MSQIPPKVYHPEDVLKKGNEKGIKKKENEKMSLYVSFFCRLDSATLEE